MKLANSHEPQQLKKDFAQMKSDFTTITKVLSDYKKEMNNLAKENTQNSTRDAMMLKKLLEKKLVSASDRLEAMVVTVDKRLDKLTETTETSKVRTDKRLSSIETTLDKKATIEELKKAIA